MGDFAARYRILSSLGKGGMGEVFLADDTQLERKVAIKFLPDELAGRPGRAEGGSSERRSRRPRSTTPTSARFTSSPKIDGQPCIVMEHVAGQTLESRLAQRAARSGRGDPARGRGGRGARPRRTRDASCIGTSSRPT